MRPLYHLIFGIIFSAWLVCFSHFSYLQISLIFFSSVLIDVDHWFVYVIKRRDFSVKAAYDWFLNLEKTGQRPNFVCIFHTLEVFVLLLSFIKLMIIESILMGFAFHLLLDMLSSLNKEKYTRKPSVILSVINYLKAGGRR